MGLEVFLSLGSHPLANSYPTDGELGGPESRYPLDVAVCDGCCLVQLMETVSPELLFGDYLYLSSMSETMLAHAEALCLATIRRSGLVPPKRVVEIGSNDGYLLDFYRSRGYSVLGVDPAEGPASLAIEKGISTRVAFFSPETANEIREAVGEADLLLGSNVLAHVPDLNGFAEAAATLLCETGVAVFEVPYLRRLIDAAEFDTIYHEHVFYFSLTALDTVFRRHGLIVEHVEEIAIHGGSLRVWLRHEGAAEPSEDVRAMSVLEAEWVRDSQTYAACARTVERLRDELVALLGDLRARGSTIAAYGAAAKGSMLTNVLGLGRETIDFVVDKNPRKQGRFMPGSHLPIVSPERLETDRPDYCLVLVWNLIDEIRRQQSGYLAAGGRFVVPIPSPKVL